MKLITMCLLLTLGLLPGAAGAAVAGDGGNFRQANSQAAQAIQSIILIHQRIEKEGYENVVRQARWPKASVKIDEGTLGEVQSTTDDNWNDCIFIPDLAGCPDEGGDFDDTPSFGPGGDSRHVDGRLKNDGVQILATEVLYQTLTFFKVKHVFGQLKDKSWGFAVINPVPGAPFQDLDTDTVLGAMVQFRKYVIGLLCDNPTPGRVLAMMNRYDVGTRFRWDMAWALLGNTLPDSPNKFMAFGAKWRRFEKAMDSIQNGSLLKIPSLHGGDVPLDPSSVTTTGAHTGSVIGVGFIAREVSGIIRLAGDIVSGILNLVCVSDLSVDHKKEVQKSEAVYKLLAVKKQLYDRYSPLRPVLDSLGQKASQIAGRKVSFYPN